jgi:sugar (pentulose or hexulose) kinase
VSSLPTINCSPVSCVGADGVAVAVAVGVGVGVDVGVGVGVGVAVSVTVSSVLPPPPPPEQPTRPTLSAIAHFVKICRRIILISYK